MKRVKLYVEGGGDSKEQHARCREGFRKLLEKAGFAGRMPRIVAGGGRTSTFDQFHTAVRNAAPEDYPIVLVDSEEPLADHATAWAHLKERDQWEQPPGTTDDQAQLMVTCMETWLIADKAALRAYFGAGLLAGALFSEIELESRPRHEVQSALERATRNCKKTYQKGNHSFEVLAELQPATLRRYLPHFVYLIEAIERHL